MTSTNTIQEVVYEKMVCFIRSNQVNVNSPFAIVTKGMEAVQGIHNVSSAEKRSILQDVLSRIAVGKDGVAGTSDDILPPKVMDEIKRMLESGLIDDFMSVAKDIAKGRFDLKNVAATAARAAPMCFKLFKI